MGALGSAIDACAADYELRIVLDLGKVSLLSSQATFEAVTLAA